jgi:hypothetical protein
MKYYESNGARLSSWATRMLLMCRLVCPVGPAPGTPKAVSVWLLDKRTLNDPNRTVDLKPTMALLEGDARQTSRLRHPGIVSVIETLEESRTHLTWVTEEVMGSLANWLHGGSVVCAISLAPASPSELTCFRRALCSSWTCCQLIRRV